VEQVKSLQTKRSDEDTQKYEVQNLGMGRPSKPYLLNAATLNQKGYKN